MNKQLKRLRPYMVWSGPDPEDGAWLVFHYSRQEARLFAEDTLRSHIDDHRWLDNRARLAADHLMELSNGEPQILIPPICPSCEMWGGVIGENDCSLCRESP